MWASCRLKGKTTVESFIFEKGSGCGKCGRIGGMGLMTYVREYSEKKDALCIGKVE